MRRKVLAVVCIGVIMSISGCGDTPDTNDTASQKEAASREKAALREETGAQKEEEKDAEETEGPEAAGRQISVQFGENTVIYELNDGTAADAFYDQLPLAIEVEDYSTNEKIFYPPEELDTTDSPLAQGGAGTLAYYAPWGDVVMFYDDYSENGSLFELGQIVSGGELVRQMSGTIVIDMAE